MLAITRNTPLFHSVPALQAGDKILHILNLSWLLYIRENILTLSKILVILIILEMLQCGRSSRSQNGGANLRAD